MRERKLRPDWHFRRGDIYMADLNPFKGSEQGGRRPVLLLQNNDGNYFSKTLIIAPMTTQLKKLDQPTHFLIRDNKALAAPTARPRESGSSNPNGYTVREAAEKYGLPVGKVYKWIREGKIRTTQDGRMKLLPKKAFDRWMRSQV